MDVHEEVQNYYGKELQGSTDLKTDACCVGAEPPQYLKELIGNIHDDVLDRFYGCGFPISAGVEGASLLDLGSGTGRDVYIYSQMVGENGQAVGVDMTKEQLEVARSVEAYQAEKFGYAKPNTQFIEGNIEDLSSAGLTDGQFDLVISNCVVNLASDKAKVFREIARVLKEGGEFYFSDVFCDRRLPDHIAKDPVLYGECLGGTLYINDFLQMIKECGFGDPRLVEESIITLKDEIKEKCGNAKFVSRTYRLFKLNDLDVQCEDYGQLAIYKGTIPNFKNLFVLDDHHWFETNRPERICRNTAKMLSETRFAEHFEVIGDTSTHYGEYPCGGTMAYDQYATEEDQKVGSCC